MSTISRDYLTPPPFFIDFNKKEKKPSQIPNAEVGAHVGLRLRPPPAAIRPLLVAAHPGKHVTKKHSVKSRCSAAEVDEKQRKTPVAFRGELWTFYSWPKLLEVGPKF